MKVKLFLIFCLVLAFCQISVTAQKKAEASFSVLPFNSLAAFAANVKSNLPRANTEGFVKPSASDRQTFYDAVGKLLAGDLTQAESLANTVNYDLAQLNDTNANRTYWILVERTANFRGSGTYIVDLSYKRNLVVEVPHPLYDLNTLEEGTTVFQGTFARALFISGTHRCANAEATTCDGTTAACGGTTQAYKVSDAAHFTGNFFQEAHRATLSLAVKPVAASLHGNAQSSLPDITLSNGTDVKEKANTLVNKLRRELLNRSASAGSCNYSKDSGLSLCGTTNVQGRLSNNSTNACNVKATKSSGLFLHIEQKINIRNDPQILIESLNAVIPVIN